MSQKDNFTFRRAEKTDMKAVIEMIQELADFERMSDGPQLSEQAPALAMRSASTRTPPGKAVPYFLRTSMCVQLIVGRAPVHESFGR
ncbi:uncharacterized protein LOC111604624 isoform X2 [Drosophila hydei]|uniref:Uncharacterized protein LOC111604624 isoform X2 n=1 Tax=Drosophila hydei TaxID=7224 RepID=A0A6J1MB36_DROHY|nr:uncharacterized protein LOC111604624 isoform X2 [Drosophila hydei]